MAILPRTHEEAHSSDFLLILLRILHIGGAVFWAGSAFFFGFIEPTTSGSRPASGPFMHHLVDKRKIAERIVAASTLALWLERCCTSVIRAAWICRG